MKSVKQQYIDLQEGKMSQQNFMRNLRMTMPQYVTNVTSFKDSVRILKNKGILSEADSMVGSKDSYDYLGKTVTIDPQSASKVGDTAKLYDQEQNEYVGEVVSVDLNTNMIHVDPNSIKPDGANAFLKEAKDEKGKWTNADGKSMYAQFKEIDNLNGQEVLIGIDYEMQKNQDLTKSEAAKIVIKNLKKNPIYYTAQDLSGVEGYEPGYIGGKSANAEARQMQPLEKNMSNVVDKKMGMQPVKGIEKPKKDSNKGGETNKIEKGVSLMSLVAKTVRGLKKMDATGEKMKKITMKEGMGEYSFTGRFVGEEAKELKKILPDAEIEVDIEPGQKITTIVTSLKYNDKSVEHAVKQAKGEIKSTPSMSAGEAVAKFLTKEDLMKMIQEELAEALGIGGTDSVNFQQDDTANEVAQNNSKLTVDDIQDAIDDLDLDPKDHAKVSKALNYINISDYKDMSAKQAAEEIKDATL